MRSPSHSSTPALPARGRRLKSPRLLVLLAALAALILPVTAASEVAIGGHASGMTIRTGDGTFMVVGTYTDASGASGTYRGSYHETTTGYSACRGIGLGSVLCDTADYAQGFPYSCNLISGEITFRNGQGRQVTLNIGSGGLAPPSSRIVSGVCLRAGSTTRDTYLLLTNRASVWPATAEEFSRGYGPLDYALGSLAGTSAPQGNSPVFHDEFALDLRLFAP